jgi:hypothetical protein
MRYARGSIQLNPVEDGFLLRQVMLARYISHEQLWTLVQSRWPGLARSTFNWRLDRLASHRLIDRHNTPSYGRGTVYSLRRGGAEYLSGQGEFFAETTHSGTRTAQESGSVLHSVELTDIYLRLHRAGVLVGWKWETEIRNQNGFTSVPYAKDYDAVVTVRVNCTDVQFALEYERMAKSRQRYAAIRELFERERSVSRFVYLAAHYDLLAFVAGQFERTRTSVCFGLFSDLMRHALDIEVVTGGPGAKASLRNFLIPR